MKIVGESQVKRLECSTFSERDEGLTIVGSSSHPSPLTATFLSKYTQPKSTMCGSSLKFMMVAEGEADVYPRFAPTCEWDTCASQIIVEEAGGAVLQAGKCSNKGDPLEDWKEKLKSLQPVVYNKKDLLNPFFVVFGKRENSSEAPLACEPDSWFKTIFG